MNTVELILTGIIVILSAARITRLLIFDTFPPIAWLRDKYAEAVDGTGWEELSFCPYCMSFWVTAALVTWGWFADWGIGWLLVNAVFAASYVASWIVRFDTAGDK